MRPMRGAAPNPCGCQDSLRAYREEGLGPLPWRPLGALGLAQVWEVLRASGAIVEDFTRNSGEKNVALRGGIAYVGGFSLLKSNN